MKNRTGHCRYIRVRIWLVVVSPIQPACMPRDPMPVRGRSCRAAIIGGHDMAGSLERGRTRVRGFADPEMDCHVMRLLGTVLYGRVAVGECLALAAGIG